MAKAHWLLRIMLDKGLQPTIVTFNVLMNGFFMSGILEDGERLTKWMFEKGVMPNATTFNSLMKQKKYVEARKLFEEMRTHGLVAEKDIYDIFVDVNYEEGNWEITLELWDEAIEKCLVNET
ncbi:pentatricopeptide repeat-containing protein mitochondrial-like [Trifolium pratense]|uniref:Pentatricopeptide repeat-containing protein mitochondrial-like n=1 Tax=Trifolium pratense TaxID=57577 RepID=A0A2K3L4C1_TRIPR|nr:pentatricopeptide repeat-containing protein mitochondrial-like [Trifolium pratense]